MREETDCLGHSNVRLTSMERKLRTILASDVVGFSKMMAATLSQMAEAEKATETLKQARTTTGLSVDRFIQSQAYREEERIAELRQVLESITD